MTDIVERLRSAAQDETQESGALYRDAADEIVRLREENRKLKAELDGYYRMGEPEC